MGNISGFLSFPFFLSAIQSTLEKCKATPFDPNKLWVEGGRKVGGRWVEGGWKVGTHLTWKRGELFSIVRSSSRFWLSFLLHPAPLHSKHIPGYLSLPAIQSTLQKRTATPFGPAKRT
jgi:hypothetical protein